MLGLVLFAVKFLFSMASFGSGAPGGIFLPMLVLGAVAGSVFGSLLNLCGLENSLQNFVILGMAGLFSAIVRAPVTGIVLISEMTGSFSHMLSCSLVSLTAYAVAELLRSRPVYETLLSRLMRGKTDVLQAGEKILMEAPVCQGAEACGRMVKEIAWPKDVLVIAIKRQELEMIPRGDTVLQAGDILVLLYDQARGGEVYTVLEKQFKNMLSAS